jgi:hypothetical protein
MLRLCQTFLCATICYRSFKSLTLGSPRALSSRTETVLRSVVQTSVLTNCLPFPKIMSLIVKYLIFKIVLLGYYLKIQLCKYSILRTHKLCLLQIGRVSFKRLVCPTDLRAAAARGLHAEWNRVLTI